MELIEDITKLIFEFINDQNQVGLVCVLWKEIYDKIIDDKLVSDSSVQFYDWKEFKPNKSFIAFLGPIQLHYDFALNVKSNLTNSEILIFDEQPNNSEFKVYLKSNKMVHVLNHIFENTHIVMTTYQQTYTQKDKLKRICDNFLILYPSLIKKIKDFTSCINCNFICKHCKVNLGSKYI